MNKTITLLCLSISNLLFSQDTTLMLSSGRTTLPEVFVRNRFDYNKLIAQIKEDTTFYKAFKNLRILNYSSLNDIRMIDGKGKIKASLTSKTTQHRTKGCRTMEIESEKTTGDFYKPDGSYNYMTAQLYAALFFTKGSICGENNIVTGHSFSLDDKKGIEKHKEQLRMLFFNPGKKIAGIPFIGNKLDIYDEKAKNIYDYKIDITEYKGNPCYLFHIIPKDNLDLFSKDRVVIDEMSTWFDIKTLSVLARNYSLSYKAGVYDFDVRMEVEMEKLGELTVPAVLRYVGNWSILFKKRERGSFTATLFNFHEE